MNVTIPSYQIHGVLSALRNSASRLVDALEPACQILGLFTEGLSPPRKCSQIGFTFEGDTRRAEIQVAAVLDDEGQFVLELNEILQSPVGPGHRLEDVLLQAAECYLDRHLPRWRVDQGAKGYFAIQLSDQSGGSNFYTGHAVLRSLKENPVSFPSPP